MIWVPKKQIALPRGQRGFFTLPGGMGAAKPGSSVPSAWFAIETWTGAGGSSHSQASLDLDDGGLVWVKRRNSTGNHTLYFKSGPGATVYAFSTNNTTAATTPAATLDASGFTVPDDISGATYVAWGFKISPGNFNIVEYTGTGVTGRTVAHGLGATPKIIVTCPLTGTKINYVQTSSLTGTTALRLDSNQAEQDGSSMWNSVSMGASNVTLGSSTLVNGNTVPFALFSFGGGDVAEGVFTGPGGAYDLNVGFKPRFIDLKRRNATAGGWGMFDTTRSPGPWTGNDALLTGNATSAEVTSSAFLSDFATGVTIATGNYNANASDTVWWAIK